MREHILSEIRRLAEENDWKAPGMARFERETGIGVSEWRGKFWTKWNEVVSDAGFEVNQPTSRSRDDDVLDEYQRACRHFGRPPTDPELRIFLRGKDAAVGASTIIKHFGGKNGVIAALRDRAIKQGEDALVAILPDVESSISADPSTPKLKEGMVYLLQSGSHYKIGRSDELEKRVKQISVSLPDKVELVHAIRTDDPPGIEAYWHRRFADRRANGEWFKLNPTDVKAFKRRKFQ